MDKPSIGARSSVNQGSVQSAISAIPDLASSRPENVLPHVEWQWHINEQTFEVDRDQCEKIFSSRLPPLTRSGLLSCLSFEDQEHLFKKIERSCRHHSTEKHACSFSLDKGKVCYAEFQIFPSNGKIVQGKLFPLLSIPSTGQTFGSLFKQILDNPHHGIVITDSERCVLLVNEYFEQHTGYSNLHLVGKPINNINSKKHSEQFYQLLWKEVTENNFWTGVVLIETADGHIIPQELTIQRIVIRERVFYLEWFVDLSTHLYRVADIEHGGVELLTQLPTESQFVQRVANHWMDCAEEKIVMALAFVPSFHRDEEFEMKSRLSEELDKNRQSFLVGYLGNNHFVAALECDKVTGPSQVRLIHQTIRQFFSSMNQSAGKEIHEAIIQGKVGVSVLGHDTYNPKLLVPHAIQAMLESNTQSKGMITFYHGAIHREVLRRKELEDLLVSSIKQQRIEVFYQPIVDTHNWDIVKFEALCRFRDEKGQLANTQEMVAIAEDMGLVADLDWCVGKRALQDLVGIQQRFGPNIGLTINRSLNTQLGAEAVLKSAEVMIEEYAKTPNLITIELTESAYFDSESSQSSLIKNIRHHGVSVAIDDFGTGYSSFTYLSDCNFDLLKIDREFVTGITVGSHKYHIVKMIAELSHTLDVKVVAEGVETRQELEVLCGIGIDYIQGYFFSKPLPLDTLHDAWGYHSQLEDFLSRKSSVRGVGILSLSQLHVPTLGPQDSIKKAKEYFDSHRLNLEVLPIVDGEVCVGLVDRENLNYYLSPTMGTKIETTKDLAIWNKTLNQVMRTDMFNVPYATKVADIGGILSQGAQPPWVVVGERNAYLGVVTHQDLLKFFASS
ncbi:EAL domain-containing protein [Vibrio sp. ZSDE26]|uniref:EAL domain-containing protein n=1 Tax=Vibrio amylolyticus TaxID=2847292 RepID=A0A9X1XF39_9VIBR|nr:EAL domain-containing protein [Vibrio amylolyticus]MCK6261872.1 EAL domain-containing protein [Vibrio amylolyticus]